MIPREGGNPRWAHVTDVKYLLPVDAVLDQMPPVSQAGRPSKLNIHPSREPDLEWTLATTLNTVHTTTTNTTSLANTQVLQDNIVTISCTTTSVIPLQVSLFSGEGSDVKIENKGQDFLSLTPCEIIL